MKPKYQMFTTGRLRWHIFIPIRKLFGIYEQSQEVVCKYPIFVGYLQNTEYWSQSSSTIPEVQDFGDQSTNKNVDIFIAPITIICACHISCFESCIF